MNEQEVLFYGEITNFSVSSFIGRMNEAKQLRKDVDILANSSGGDADAGFGFIKAIRDFPFKKKLSIHGSAYSMMAYAALFVDEVVAIEQSLFLFHRAASFFFGEDSGIRDLLAKRNATLRQAMEEKLDIEAFERISGVTLDQLFSMDSRIDVTLTAEQAMDIGLVSEIISLSANETDEINSMMMAASHGVGIQPITINAMNKDELKNKHPELYAEVIEIGKKEATPAPQEELVLSASAEPTTDLMQAGIQKERERVAAWQVYYEVDPKKVSAGIASGKAITMADTQEFLLASTKKTFAGALQKGTNTDGGEGLDPNLQNADDQLPDELNTMAANVTDKLKKKLQKAS